MIHRIFSIYIHDPYPGKGSDPYILSLDSYSYIYVDMHVHVVYVYNQSIQLHLFSRKIKLLLQ